MCVALATAAFTAAAQNRSGYFLDNYAYNYQLNPAMGRDGKFDIGFPMLGSMNIGVNSNMGLNTFLYKQDGRMVTFMHPDISADEAMKKFKNDLRLGFELRENIINIGFRGLGGYNHISINAVAEAQIRMPKALFSFMKEGISNRNYEIGRMAIQAGAYGEIALNHSHDLSHLVPGLKVGGTFKFLIGIANIDMYLNKADLNLGEDAWTAYTEGAAKMSVKGFDWTVNDDGQIDGGEVNGFSAPNGYGMAFDLGATYEWKDFTFALAFNDLGFINWSSTAVAGVGGEHSFNSNDYTLDPDDFDSSFDKMKDDLTSLFDFKPDGEVGSHTRAIAATMNASVEYTLPMYNKVSFGLLNTTRMARKFAWTDFRFSANYMPAKWFGLTMNYGVGTFGSHFGWMINLAPKGFNLFVGMDHTLGSLSKQYIPKNLNGQLSFGINFPI